MMQAGERTYNIRVVERLTGIPAATLRSWERRYGFPMPRRTLSARRLYSERDVAALQWLSAQTAQGLSVAQAIRWLQQNAGTVALRPPAADPAALVHAFLESVARFDEAAAEQSLADAFAQLSPDRAVAEVIRPILIEVGDRWAHGDLSVGVEHFASYLIRRRLLALLAAQPPLGSLPAAVLACVPGEQHEFGLLMLALFLRWAGMRVIYLGANVPLTDLVRCVRETQPAVVCLSVVYTPLAGALTDTVAGLRAAGLSVPVFVGGAAAGDAPLPGDVMLLREELASAAVTIVSRAGAAPSARGRSSGSPRRRRPRSDDHGGTMRPNMGEVPR